MYIYKYMKAGSSVHIPSARTGSLESVFVLLQTQSTQVCLSKCGGCKLVIYDNCFLQINHLWREHAAEDVKLHQRELWGRMWCQKSGARRRSVLL